MRDTDLPTLFHILETRLPPPPLECLREGGASDGGRRSTAIDALIRGCPLLISAADEPPCCDGGDGVPLLLPEPPGERYTASMIGGRWLIEPPTTPPPPPPPEAPPAEKGRRLPPCVNVVDREMAATPCATVWKKYKLYIVTGLTKTTGQVTGHRSLTH